MNKYIPTIGLEIHTELNTKSKMFSNSINDINSPINTNVNEIDLGLPGVLPSPNKQAVIKAIKLCKALNMEINPMLKFDRKNYFYQDLPKGFQITQQYFPIGKNGQLNGVSIQRIHLEEDTAKQFMLDNKLHLDYNRAGIPLIEIVTEPVIHSTKSAIDFLTALRNILIFGDISDGKMEEGSFRVDINISMSKQDSQHLGTKVEIKNVNSFFNISEAIEFEINRQTELLLQNKVIQQETRRWDDVSHTTKFMRQKSNEIDYHYFPEPNIINIDISSLINQTSASQLPSQIKQALIDQSIPQNFVDQLINNFDAYKKFRYLSEKINNPKAIVSWLLIELPPLLKEKNETFIDIKNTFLDNIVELILLIQDNKINGKQAKVIFENMYKTNESPSDLITKLGFKQLTDDVAIEKILQEIIDSNKEMLNQYLARPERVEKMFIGLLMKQTKGQANPLIAIEILRRLIKSLI